MHKFENRNVYNYEKGKEIRIVTFVFRSNYFSLKRRRRKKN